jgi:Zn finger protein HypA/HybF involved in hydrogenase expression
MNNFWCMDCRTVVILDTHGRCDKCKSDAVTIATPPRMEAKLQELEQLYLLGAKEV